MSSILNAILFLLIPIVLTAPIEKLGEHTDDTKDEIINENISPIGNTGFLSATAVAVELLDKKDEPELIAQFTTAEEHISSAQNLFPNLSNNKAARQNTDVVIDQADEALTPMYDHGDIIAPLRADDSFEDYYDESFYDDDYSYEDLVRQETSTLKTSAENQVAQ